MKFYKKIIYLLSAPLTYFYASGLTAEPRIEGLIQSKQLDAKIFVSAIHRDAGKKITATFVWIPREFEDACLEREFAHCKAITDCKVHAKFKSCENYATATNCRDEVRPDCTPFMKKASSQGSILLPPHQLLEYVPSTLPKKVSLKIAPLIDDKKFIGTKGLPSPTNKFSFTARVKWEKWTNGENFQIIEFK